VNYIILNYPYHRSKEKTHRIQKQPYGYAKRDNGQQCHSYKPYVYLATYGFTQKMIDLSAEKRVGEEDDHKHEGVPRKAIGEGYPVVKPFPRYELLWLYIHYILKISLILLFETSDSSRINSSIYCLELICFDIQIYGFITVALNTTIPWLL